MAIGIDERGRVLMSAQVQRVDLIDLALYDIVSFSGLHPPHQSLPIAVMSRRSVEKVKRVELGAKSFEALLFGPA